MAAVDFDWWAGTAVLGLGQSGRLEQIVSEAIRGGVPAGHIGGNPPTAFLLAWPSRAGGLMCCIRSGLAGAPNEFVVAWPFAATGIAHEMVIRAFHEDVDCPALRLVEGSVEGHDVVALDGGYATAAPPLPASVPVRLHAWAVRVERAPADPIRLRADQVSESLRAIFGAHIDDVGHLAFDTHALVALLPAREGVSPLYEFQSPVKSVRAGTTLPGMTAWTLTIAIFRMDDDDREIDIELTVTDAIWPGTPPMVGEPVRGLLWLQVATSLR